MFVTLRPHWFGWFEPGRVLLHRRPGGLLARPSRCFVGWPRSTRTLLGAEVYAALVPALEQAWAERGERLRAAWGTPTDLGQRTVGAFAGAGRSG